MLIILYLFDKTFYQFAIKVPPLLKNDTPTK